VIKTLIDFAKQGASLGKLYSITGPSTVSDPMRNEFAGWTHAVPPYPRISEAVGS